MEKEINDKIKELVDEGFGDNEIVDIISNEFEIGDPGDLAGEVAEIRSEIFKKVAGKDFVKIKEKAQGLGRNGGPAAQGPEGECVCAECGYKMPHKTGVPCNESKCPKCGAVMGPGTTEKASNENAGAGMFVERRADGKWYVVNKKNKKVVAGPFDFDDDAKRKMLYMPAIYAEKASNEKTYKLEVKYLKK